MTIYFLNEIWLYGLSDQIYLITLLMVFSLVAYLYIKNREAQQLDIPVREQYYFLKTIAESSSHAELYLDSYNRVQFVNSKFCDLFSVETQDILGSDINNLNLLEGIRSAAISEDQSKSTFSIDSDKTVQVLTTSVKDGDGAKVGTLLRFERVPDAVKGISDQELSHELKTPLNAILGLSEVLKSDDKVPESYQKLFSDISNQSSVLNRRINRWILGRDQPSPPNTVEIPDALDGNTILIVDDVTINRTLLRMMLEKRGFKTVEAENGKEAIQKIKSVKPSIVLMDLSMPVMDGLEAVTRIRKMKSSLATIPIIAVTASRNHSEKSLIKHGFNGLVKKPFKESDLFRFVGEPETV